MEQYLEYQRLLFQKDAVEKEAFEIQNAYLRIFGELLQERMELEIQCRLRKHAISLCVFQANQGKPADRGLIREQLDAKMQDYQQKLDQFSLEIRAARTASPISQEEVRQIKKIYRSLARMVHPDLHPDIWKIEGIAPLWQKAKDAYDCNDLTAIQEAQTQILSLLPENFQSGSIPEVEHLKEKILRLQQTIQKILTTKPYILQIYLDEPEKSRHRRELEDEIQQLQDYLNDLDQALEEQFYLKWRDLWQMN